MTQFIGIITTFAFGWFASNASNIKTLDYFGRGLTHYDLNLIILGGVLMSWAAGVAVWAGAFKERYGKKNAIKAKIQNLKEIK